MLDQQTMCSAHPQELGSVVGGMIEIPGQKNLWILAGLYPGQCSVLEILSHQHGSAAPS